MQKMINPIKISEEIEVDMFSGMFWIYHKGEYVGVLSFNRESTYIDGNILVGAVSPDPMMTIRRTWDQDLENLPYRTLNEDETIELKEFLQLGEHLALRLTHDNEIVRKLAQMQAKEDRNGESNETNK